MAVRSKDFVGIAEGIKSHELSTKGKIESLKGTISELSGRRNALNNQISYLEAALSAAYEDTDEDGDPDYSRISAIESQINSAESELSGVEQQLDGAQGELSQSEAELDSVMEEKAQTLFEIQERARTTSKNISVAGGMYGAYSGVGGSLQSSLQSSFSSLSQAASILDGSVGGATGGGSGQSGSSTGPSTNSDLSTSPLSAFAGSANSSPSGLSGSSAGVSNPADFSTSQSGNVTPATTPNFHSGQKTINPQKTLNFNSDQSANSYATSSFSENGDNKNETEISAYNSSQESSEMEGCFVTSNNDKAETKSTPLRGDLEKRRAWAQQYSVGFSPVASSNSVGTSGSSSTSNPDRGQREIFDELEHGFSLSGMFNKKSTPSPTSATHQATYKDKRKTFVQSLQTDVKPIHNYSSSSTTNSGGDDYPNIGARTKERTTEEYERNILAAFGLSHLSKSIARKDSPVQPKIQNQILNNQSTHISARNQLLKEPRSLTRTAQTWSKGAGGTLTYNSPIETGKKLDFKQGKVNGFLGTCGLCSCENILRLAGVPVSEADIVSYASTTYEETDGSFVSSLTRKTLCTTNSAPSSNGGTSAATRKKILDHFGVPSYTAPQSIHTIADAISNGHGVIASVHAETLYFGRRPIHPDLHAITITSVQKDSIGNILGFYVCDSNAAAFGGTGATYYTAEELEKALSERECNITTTIIR